MASGSFYNYPTGSFGVYCEWSSTLGTDGYSTVTLKTYLSYYTINIGSSKWTTSIDGNSATFTSDAIKVSSASSWSKKLLNTRTLKVKHDSDGTKKVTLSASYPFNGTYSGTSIGTITASKTVSLDTITDCTAPTSFSVTADRTDGVFESVVSLAWSGAKGGSGNTISSYFIRYRTKSSSSGSYGSWADLTTVTSTSTSGSKSIDISSKVSRGYYVQFSIQARGSAGSNFYSGYKESSAIRRNPYTTCTAPTSITVTPNNFDATVTISWSGAGAGTSNSISSYYIQYATSSNNSTWGSWTGLTTVNSTSSSGSKTIDVSSNVSRGYYIKFRIRTQGSAGSSYYSGYKESSSVLRQPYTSCVAPTTITLSPDMSSSFFESSITIQWSGASGGTNNSISSYLIRYSTSTDNSTWGNYADLTTVNTTSASGSTTINVSAKVTRGHYIKLAIRTQGSAGSDYYSGYTYSTTLQRNPYTKCTAPTQITLTSEKGLNGSTYTNVFENSITMSFSNAKAGENNTIVGYSVQYRQSDDKITWDGWRVYGSYESTNTAESYELNIADVVRGKYIQFQIATLSSQSGYDSDYVESPIIRKNSIPSNVSAVDTNLLELEYSYGDDIIIGWSEPSDIDSNIYKYQIILYQNINGTFTNILEDEVGASNLSFTLDSSNEAYQSIKNNEQIKFAVRPIDVFGLASNGYTESKIITRYDDTGVCIGVNGEWINCQIYVGVNGEWVEQSVGAGVNNTWLQCGLK